MTVTRNGPSHLNWGIERETKGQHPVSATAFTRRYDKLHSAVTPKRPLAIRAWCVTSMPVLLARSGGPPSQDSGLKAPGRT